MTPIGAPGSVPQSWTLRCPRWCALIFGVCPATPDASRPPRHGKPESSVELRRRELDEVLADFDARGVGLRSRDNLTRDELYDEATGKSDALR